MDAWKPSPKIVAAAVATIAAWGLQTATGLDVPPGIESAFAVVVAYMVPSTVRKPINGAER